MHKAAHLFITIIISGYVISLGFPLRDDSSYHIKSVSNVQDKCHNSVLLLTLIVNGYSFLCTYSYILHINVIGYHIDYKYSYLYLIKI